MGKEGEGGERDGGRGLDLEGEERGEEGG